MMAYSDNYLGIDEKIILKRRPARRGFALEYFTILVTIIAGIILAVYRLQFWLNTWYDLASKYTILLELTIILLVFLIIKAEYKIWSKRYIFTTKKIIIRTEIFDKNYKSITYDKITAIGVQQSSIDKILNVGTLTLHTDDNLELVLQKIPNPNYIQKKIIEEQAVNITGEKKIEHYHQ